MSHFTDYSSPLGPMTLQASSQGLYLTKRYANWMSIFQVSALNSSYRWPPAARHFSSRFGTHYARSLMGKYGAINNWQKQ